MPQVYFTILGSSAGMPQPDRVNSGYLLEAGGRLIQFDCGGGVSAAFRRAGFDPLGVERIVISHTHPAHISDLPLYVQMLYLAGRKTAFDIHLPQEAVRSVQDWFRALYLLPGKLPFDVGFVPVTADKSLAFGEITIFPISNRHLAGYAPILADAHLDNRMQSFSYLITVGGKNVLYSADLASESDLKPYLGNLDLLVVESTHIDIARLLQAIVAANVGRVVLTHIAEDYDVAQTLLAAHKAGVGNLCMAHDGMRIAL